MSEIAVAAESTATQEAERWLGAFETALADRNAAAAAALFATDSYWRDLVAFTWNLKTVEGREGVADLVEHSAGQTGARGFHVTEPATEADGVTEAWIRFETEVGRGLGHLRLKEGKAWTLLTTLYELKGHEERKRERRPMGAEHGATKERRTWLEKRRQEAAELGHKTQPYVVIVGGGQGGIALGARLR
ncbi:MAG: putative flavoprotein involved in transport, partial [Solirubrobacteraceae bacterium]|nr:putative flavoprotein involved in transport [Solirubrobacteraceae bacterium]